MNDLDGIPRGAYVELEDLVKLRLLANELSLTPLLRPRTTTSGIRQSRHRGRGIDFEEVRSYQPGDDVRTIDWRVTARTSKVHTKVFREEKDRPVFVLIDQRKSMFFGSRHCCKSVQAAWLAALVSWISLLRGDQVGGMVLGENKAAEIRPRRSHHHVLRLLKEIHRLNNVLHRDLASGERSDLGLALNDLRRALHPGTLLFIISDCHDLTGTATVHLHNLSRHCEICVLRVRDILEQQLPLSGDHLFTDGSSRLRLSSSSSNRERYAVQQQQQSEDLQGMLNNLRIPLVEVDTSQPSADLFRSRSQQRRSA